MITFFILFILSVFIWIIGCVLTEITVIFLYTRGLILKGIEYIYYKIKGNNNEN